MDEMIRRANDTNFGLAAAVWTRDIGQGPPLCQGGAGRHGVDQLLRRVRRGRAVRRLQAKRPGPRTGRSRPGRLHGNEDRDDFAGVGLKVQNLLTIYITSPGQPDGIGRATFFAGSAQNPPIGRGYLVRETAVLYASTPTSSLPFAQNCARTGQNSWSVWQTLPIIPVIRIVSVAPGGAGATHVSAYVSEFSMRNLVMKSRKSRLTLVTGGRARGGVGHRPGAVGVGSIFNAHPRPGQRAACAAGCFARAGSGIEHRCQLQRLPAQPPRGKKPRRRASQPPCRKLRTLRQRHLARRRKTTPCSRRSSSKRLIRGTNPRETSSRPGSRLASNDRTSASRSTAHTRKHASTPLPRCMLNSSNNWLRFKSNCSRDDDFDRRKAVDHRRPRRERRCRPADNCFASRSATCRRPS